MVKDYKIKDLKLYQPRVYSDKRGYFFECFNDKLLKKIKSENLIQCNISKSKQNVLRGLHYQENPFSQGKLVWVLEGKIFDVAVDLRKKSKTYGKYKSFILSSKEKNFLWIPRNFAHGFYVLSKFAIVQYFVDNKYNPKKEKTICWDNENLKINWPAGKKIISNKDSICEKYNF